MTFPWRTPAALAFQFLLVAGFYWQLTVSRRYTWIENPDQAIQVRPWLDYEARELHAGRLPLWTPYEWGGQSLIGQVQPGLVNPLNWPLFAMPLRDGHIPIETLHWYWVLIHWVAAAFTYWMCRDLGAGHVAAIFGGAVYALSGFLGHSLTPQFLMGAVWIPLILLFFGRVLRGRRVLSSAAWCGAALGAAFLGGHHNIPIYTSVVLLVLWHWQLARNWRKRQMWIAAAVCGATAFLIAAIQILPAVEYGRQSLRWVGTPDALKWHDRVPYNIHAEYSLGAQAIPGLVLPGLAHHAQPFVGAVAISLAILALWLGWRRPEVRMLAGVAAGGLLLALGRDTPLEHIAYTLIPMVEKARYPAFAIVICQAAIAGLAALGLEAWRKAGSPRRAACWPSAIAAAICSYDVVCRFQHRPLDPLWPMIAASAGLALLLAMRRCPAAAVLPLFLLEALAVPSPLQLRDSPSSYARMMESQRDIFDFLRSRPGWFRVEADEDLVPYNFGDFYSLEQFGGATASMPIAVQAMAGRRETPRLFGIVYRVARQPSNQAQMEVFESRSGLKVYRDPSIPPPLWVERTPAPGCPADQLTVSIRTPEYTRFAAAFGCPGLLVVGDPWFTGWRAWVDGRRVRIQQYQGVLRAVALESGAHRVEFRYQPGAVWWGAALTFLGLCATIVLHRFVP